VGASVEAADVLDGTVLATGWACVIAAVAVRVDVTAVDEARAHPTQASIEATAR
jgi:hypothetical protein